jgi:cell wall-associated NlpC family hydrolase
MFPARERQNLVQEEKMRTILDRVGLLAAALALSWLAGCRTEVRTVPAPSIPPYPETVPAPVRQSDQTVTRSGYTVQVGAFAVLDNARALVRSLAASGLDAFYFPAERGLYKVRFGDFPSRDAAVREAERLRGEARIGDYFVVAPEEYAVYRPGPSAGDLREGLAATAASFIGVDYSWGGTSSRTGFDCSGLVRAVYQLNGLNIPRSVGAQYAAGSPVPRERLMKGDLVFFSGSPGGELTHVGIYVGRNTFIHAPGRGKKVREESLDNDYFRTRFSGARAYLKPRPLGAS